MFFREVKKKKYIKRVFILTLAGVVTAGTILSTTQQAMANPTLPGVEKIIQDNSTENPFVILEILPDKSDAALGYLVAGEEPVDASGKSIKDMPGSGERLDKFAASDAFTRIEKLGIKGAVSAEAVTDADGNVTGVSYTEPAGPSTDDSKKKSVDIRGVFEHVGKGETGIYSPTDSSQMYAAVEIVANDVTPGEGQATLEQINKSNTILYREYMSFSVDDGENGDGENTSAKKYKIELSVLDDTDIMPVEIKDDVYNAQFWVAEEIEFEMVSDDESGDGSGNETDDGQGDESNDEPKIEWTTSLEVGDLIFKVEDKSDDGVPTKLSYVGVLESEEEVAMFSMRPSNLEEEEVPEEEVPEEEVPEEEEDILGEGDIPDEGTDTPKDGDETPKTPNEGSELPKEEDETPGEGSETPNEGTDTPKDGDETPKTPNEGSGLPEEEDETPDEGTDTTKDENEIPDEGSNGDTDTPGGNDDTTQASLITEERVRALREKGIFVPTQIGQMYRMSITLEDVEDIKTAMDSGESYVVVREADGGDTDVEYYYYISSIEESEAGDMFAATSYGEVTRPSGGYPEEYIGKTFYTYNDTSLPYTYDPANGTYSFRADYTQQVYDTVSYEGGFINEEWFKKYVFDLEDSQLADMSIDVVPVTISELTQELLDKADLIYFADSFGTGFSSGGAQQDDGKWMVQFTFDDEEAGFSNGGAQVHAHGNASVVEVDGRKAIYLDGDGDFLSVTTGGGSSLLTGESEITVSFDMKVADSWRTDWGLFAAPDLSTQTWPYEHYIGIFEKNTEINVERFDNNGSRPESINVKNEMPSNTWRKITVVFKESEYTLYVDGTPKETLSSEYSLEDILGNGSIFQIGKGNWGSGEYSKAWIDNYTITNYAMEPSEIGTNIGEKTIYENILEKVGEGVPVALNRSLYEKETNDLQIRKMAACLMQEDVMDPFGSAGVDGAPLETMGLSLLSKTMRQPLSDTGSLNFVNGNVFVYDDLKNSNVVSNNFHKEIFSNAEVNYGFTELIEEIQNENFYREVAGKDELIEEKVTMATALRHIINYGDRRNVTKTTLRVLDLEPYDFEDYYEGSEGKHGLTAYEDIWYKNIDSQNSINVSTIETDSICLTDGKLDKKRWIIDNLAPQFEDNSEDLSVTIMGSREYIGKIEDINENYDLIYLGMDTSIMNTQIDTVNGRRIKTDKTVYNDSDMKGLVYTHVGDRITMNSGIVSGTDNRYIRGSYRMSGNDITSDKVRELKEYIEAGYAVIISDEMVIKDGEFYTVNKEKIDKTSNMYKLLNDVILKKVDGTYRYFGKNVNVKSAFESTNASAVVNREKFSRYMGISKLTLEYSESDLPITYDEGDGVADYLPMDSDGIYRLKYRIKLRNDAAVDLTNTNYNCKLYVDIDADGRYSEDEVLTGLRITDGGSEKIPDENGKYHLSVGHTYEISRAIPEGYTGFIAWKLVFEQNGQEYDGVSERALVRSAVEGYSAVPHSGEKPQIKILQITNADGNTNLNLKTDKDMQSYYKDAKLDFGIDVTVISAKEFVRKTAFSNKSHAEYLKEYDMLVMGFFDSYKIGEGSSTGSPDTNTVDAMLAIREYALSGRSILFTHDLSGFNITDDSEKTWSWYANRYLRDIQGMDRFGIMSKYNTIPSDDKYLYQSVYDTALLEGEEYTDTICYNGGSVERYEPMALNNVLLANNSYRKDATYGETSRRASSVMNWSWEYTSWGKHQNLGDVAVSQVNRGQITEYPYKISENFNVSGTHSQYMQLNLDTDSRDKYTNDDIVVWYTLDKRNDNNLKDSIYTAVEKDVRNNYFIFNKGNITYTGSGHRSVTSQEEKKLFLNTLVAAYRTGLHAPRVMYKENEWETSATITSQYLPYDPNMNDGSGGFLEETLPVHFYTTNVNLQKTNENLYTKYYIDGTESNYDIYVDGRYYKEVTPTGVKRLVEENGQVVKVDETPAELTNNSMHTATFKYADIGLGNNASIKDKYSTNIYIRVGYEELAAPGADKELALPASESLSKLNIVCTQLFELR